MLEPLGNLIRRWTADPRPATTLALCQALAEAGEAHRAAPPADWAQYVAVCAEVGRVVAERFALDLDVLLAAGRMHLAAGATWDAQSATLQAAKIAPDEPRGWVLLGEALLRRGDVVRATRSFDRAAAAGVRVDPNLAEMARVLAAGPPATREQIADVVAHRLGYAAIPPPPGVPSMIAPAMSTSAPAMPAVAAPPAPSGLPNLNPPDRDEDAGELTARHEFDREELMALLRASEDGGGRMPLDEESTTRQRPAPPRPAPPRPPVQSDAFTLIRGAVDDETTTDTHDVPTSIGQVPRELLESIQAGRPDPRIDVPRVGSGSIDEIVPTVARQLAPRSPDARHHARPEAAPVSSHVVADDTSEGETIDVRRVEMLVPPRTQQPGPAPVARVIVEPQRRGHGDVDPPAPPGAVPVPPPPPRDPAALPGLIDDASASGERPVPTSGPDAGGASLDPPAEGRRPRRRVLGWLLGAAGLAAAGAAGAHLWRQRQREGQAAAGREAARRSSEALDAGDLRAAGELGERAIASAPADPDAVRAAVEARIVGVLDGATPPDAAVDVVTTARRLGAEGALLAAATLAAAVGAGNGSHARALLEQHARDGVGGRDAVYQLTRGAALDLLVDAAAIDAYARARELRPALGSAAVRHVRALVLAGRVGEARAVAQGVELPKPVATTVEVLLARADQPERWPPRDLRIDRDLVGDLPRPLRAIGAALALVPPDTKGGHSMGLDAALDDADTPGALLLAGQLALAARDLDGALGAAKRAIAMDEGWTPAHALAARVLLLRGRLDEALALGPSLPPAVALELRAIAAYESTDPEALAEAESRAVEKGVPRWPALALALSRLRSGAKRPKPAEADGLVAENVVWADVLAVDLAIDAGELDRAKKIADGWGATPDPSRALRLARLLRVSGDLDGAAKMVAAAGTTRWARLEGVLLAAESRGEREKAIEALKKDDDGGGLGDLTPFALAYLRAREGAFQAAKATLAKVKIPKGGPLEARALVLLGAAAARDTAAAKGLTDLVDALKGRPEIVWAGVMLGELPPTRMPKGMK